eukprot:CAMPEP_0197399014 /NCGR_PEP_ID=MMETSP1165-20131217/14430_1 /TAXON_ID=284809 /ORGANISM="Chrysocystis fragilis, Strain CCMP3189" /LENGTH=201 /DNA_ID=CAMNT_0042924997 /DNA_START=72 /DNA_END=678 /DNA_ORIENTATION=+
MCSGPHDATESSVEEAPAEAPVKKMGVSPSRESGLFEEMDGGTVSKDKSMLRVLYCLGGGDQSAETYEQAMQRCRAQRRLIQPAPAFDVTQIAELAETGDVEPASLEWWSGEVRDDEGDTKANIAAAAHELLFDEGIARNSEIVPALEVTVVSKNEPSPTVELNATTPPQTDFPRSPPSKSTEPLLLHRTYSLTYSPAMSC